MRCALLEARLTSGPALSVGGARGGRVGAQECGRWAVGARGERELGHGGRGLRRKLVLGRGDAGLLGRPKRKEERTGLGYWCGRGGCGLGRPTGYWAAWVDLLLLLFFLFSFSSQLKTI